MEVHQINEDIEDIEKTELIQKRENNVYDTVGLVDENHVFYKRVHEIMLNHH